MNIVTWNVRGLGRPAKWFLVKDFLNLHFAEVCCLKESKIETISVFMWREIGGSRLNQFAYIAAKGSAGDMIIGWNSAMLIGRVIKVGVFSLMFICKLDSLEWRYTMVYAPMVRNLKQVFWEEIRTYKGAQDLQWIVGGDFNAIFDLEDKMSVVPNLLDIRNANELLQDLGLLEPLAFGRKFTWTNGEVDLIWVKLDRFLINNEWVAHFPKLIQNSLPRLGSDHVPIRLEVGIYSSNPRPFRF